MISDNLIASGVIQLGIGIATLAGLKVLVTEIGRRTAKNEERLDGLSKEFVPRSEVEHVLEMIERTTDQTLGLVKAFISGGRMIQAGAGDYPVDPPSEERLALVHPELARRVHAAMAELAKEGTYFRVAQGLRTYEQQDALEAQGRTTPGHIVTNARGGYSNDNFGCAVDCFPFLSGSSGEINWNAGSLQFRVMVQALQAQGLVWGGEWIHMPDAPHFQLPGVAVTPTDADRATFAKGGLHAVWASIPAEPKAAETVEA